MRPYLVAAGLVIVVVLGVGLFLLVAGISRPSAVSCFLVLRAGDRHAETYRRDLSDDGYTVRITGSTGKPERPVLRASVKTELTFRMGLEDEDNGPQLEAAMAQLVPGERPRPHCSSEGLFEH